MNKVILSGTAHDFCSLSEGKYVFDFEFESNDDNGGTRFVTVECKETLADEIAENLRNGDKITVIGKLDVDEEVVENRFDETKITAFVIITDNDEVYPKYFPSGAAIAERDRERSRQELARIVDEASQPDDPF